MALAVAPVLCYGQEVGAMVARNVQYLSGDHLGEELRAEHCERANSCGQCLNYSRATEVANDLSKEQSKFFSEYLSDYASGEELKSVNADKRHEIASMVKIMTANMVFEAIDKGKISLDTQVNVSPTASGMGGSQMFLDSGVSYSVNDLLKGIIVVSANDASVAMAETLSGSHESFVAEMNLRAKTLGMNNTLFCNATGLPSNLEQYSTARDVNIMTRALMSHNKYFDYAKITLEDYVHPSGRKTQFVNTNKLMRYYKGCIGGKTGFTAKAGFCLSACAERNNFKVVATVIGATESKARFGEVSGLFDYAYANYSNTFICRKGDTIDKSIAIKGGKEKALSLVAAADINILCKNGEARPEVQYNLPAVVKAPIKQGDKVGTATIVRGEKTIEVDIVAKDDVHKLTYWDYIKNIGSKF